LPHLTTTGTAHMVSVSAKPSTLRTAVAVGHVRFSNAQPLPLIRSNALKKGDVLSVARIAGIMAAKRTPDLVPLCHPIMLEHVGVEVRIGEPAAPPLGLQSAPEPESEAKAEGKTGARVETRTRFQTGNESKNAEFGSIHICAKVQCTGPTGVEMEALSAVMGAALTVVDMCKAVDRGMRIEGVRVVLKEGGRSGVWRE
ncbi:hypothetical protein K491DRAFT_551090, partial [Lophiostoma macrostomum CBS 122681]